MRVFWVGSVCLLAGIALGAEPPGPLALEVPASPAPAAGREGLERGEWRVEGFGNPGEAEVVRPRGQEENRMLRVAYRAGPTDKVAVRRESSLAAADAGTLRGCVYCAEAEPPRVAFALCTGAAQFWQETEAVRLKPGWNELRFDLAAKNWKSASSTWKNEAALQDREDIRALQFLVFNGNAAGVLWLDALKLDRAGKTAGIEALVLKLGAEDFDERERAEKALVEVGRPALECLREALEGADAEVVSRARRIIERISGTRGDAANPQPEQQQGGVLVFPREWKQ